MPWSLTHASLFPQVLESVVDISSGTKGVEDEEEEEEVISTTNGESYSLHGSLGPKYGGESDLFYSQFDLSNRESKVAQIVLLKVSTTPFYNYQVLALILL